MIALLLLCALVFATSAGIDYAGTRYVQSVQGRRKAAAATWTVLQWAAGTVGFVVAVKSTMWVLPFEGAGLCAGTLIAMRAS